MATPAPRTPSVLTTSSAMASRKTSRRRLCGTQRRRRRATLTQPSFAMPAWRTPPPHPCALEALRHGKRQMAARSASGFNRGTAPLPVAAVPRRRRALAAAAGEKRNWPKKWRRAPPTPPTRRVHKRACSELRAPCYPRHVVARISSCRLRRLRRVFVAGLCKLPEDALLLARLRGRGVGRPPRRLRRV